MKKDKKVWIEQILDSLEKTDSKSGISNQFQDSLKKKLTDIRSPVKKLPAITVMAAAASFSLLMVANIWLYTRYNNQVQLNQESEYVKVIDEYHILPPTFGNTYDL